MLEGVVSYGSYSDQEFEKLSIARPAPAKRCKGHVLPFVPDGINFEITCKCLAEPANGLVDRGETCLLPARRVFPSRRGRGVRSRVPPACPP